MTLPPPLSISYWLKPSPPWFMPIVSWLFLGVALCAVIVGAILYFLRMRGGMDKFLKKTLGRAASLLISFGLIGLALYLLLYEHVPYLSMRLWIVVWLVTYGYYAWRLIKFVFVDRVRQLREKEEREKFEKWLPKKKD